MDTGREVDRDNIVRVKYEILLNKYEKITKENEKLSEQVYQTNRMVAHLQKRRFLLLKRLENYDCDLRSRKRKFVEED